MLDTVSQHSYSSRIAAESCTNKTGDVMVDLVDGLEEAIDAGLFDSELEAALGGENVNIGDFKIESFDMLHKILSTDREVMSVIMRIASASSIHVMYAAESLQCELLKAARQDLKECLSYEFERVQISVLEAKHNER